MLTVSFTGGFAVHPPPPSVWSVLALSLVPFEKLMHQNIDCVMQNLYALFSITQINITLNISGKERCSELQQVRLIDRQENISVIDTLHEKLCVNIAIVNEKCFA